MKTETGTGARWIVPALVGGYLAVALALALRLDIWIDEAYTLETTGRGVGYALLQALSFEGQPPLYFVLLGLWREIDGSIFFARLFSVLCGAAALWVVAAVSRRWLPEVHPGWLTAVAGFNPFFFYAALEIRLYSLALLLSALLLVLLHDGFLAPEPRRSARWGYGVVAVLSLYTQYYLGFSLVAGAVAVFAFGRWRSLWAYLLTMAGVAVCFAPMLSLIPGQAAAHTVVVERGSLLEGVGALGGRVQEFAWPTEGLPEAWRLAARVGFALALVLLVFVHRRFVGRREVAVWALTATLVLIFLAVRLGVTGPHLMQTRHNAALYLPALLAVLSAVLLTRRRWALGMWTGGLILLSAVSMAETYGPLARPGDWARVGSFLEGNVRPGEPVLVFIAEGEIALKHYYRRPEALVPLPAAEDFRAYDLQELVLHDESEIDAAIAQVPAQVEPGDSGSVWVVTYPFDPNWLGIDYGRRVLEGYLAGRYRLEREVKFYGTRVRHFTKR